MRTKIIAFYMLIGLIFILTPFYTGPNIGGTGLHLPFNISIWFGIPWFICAGIVIFLSTKRLYLPQSWYFFLPLIVLLILTGLVNNSEPVDWLFRLGFIIGGGLFLFALFQFSLSQSKSDLVLYVLLFAMSLHGLIGVVQALFPSYLPASFPPSPKGIPYGIFQQINIQASYMVTSLVIVTYLISRPRFLTSNLFLKIVLLAAIAISSYVVFTSGSRIGLLTLLLSLPLMVFCRRQQLAKHKLFILMALLVMNVTAWYGQEGIAQSAAKMANLTQGEYKAARLSMYKVGMELVVEKPFLGHGIGSFGQVWAEQTADFHQRFPNAILPDASITTHPHNEFLYWLIETGVVLVFGFVLLIASVIHALFKCGLSRGGAYAAMLLPITLHTQVELPFYGSSAHWFTWLFLLYLPLRHTIVSYSVMLSRSALVLIYFISVFSAFSLSAFMFHTFKAQLDIFHFVRNESKPPYLQKAMNNFYFKELAIEVAMRASLYQSIKRNDEVFVRSFIAWANSIGPSRSMLIYEDLVKAFDYLNYKEVDCYLLKAGADIYFDNKKLESGYERCLNQ